MHKLNLNETAALKGAVVDTIAAQNGVEANAIVTQMTLRVAGSAGAVYVDDKEKPTKCVYLLLGTFGILGDTACIIMAAESEDGEYGVLFMAAKQFAKEFGCKSIIVGDFSGSGAQHLKDKLKSPDAVSLHIQKL